MAGAIARHEVLERRGETIHPASAELASESAHFDLEAGEHELHAFEALRRMDEILCANFMVFHDVVTEDAFDLWIGDEAWDVDHFLHENPELKTAAYAWLTDFVGFLPVPDGGEREAFLTADYNAEMIEHVERFPRVRDRAIFVGDPDDIVPGTFGPGLPGDPRMDRTTLRLLRIHPGVRSSLAAGSRELRAELGWERRDDLRRRGRRHRRRRTDAAACRSKHSRVTRAVPDLRMIAVAGPRIDAGRCPSRRDWRSAATCTSSTVRSPRATSRWSRAD